MSKVIVLLTHSKDFYTIDRVEEAISRKGCHPFRFNTDRFPQHIKLSIGLKGQEIQLSLKGEDEEKTFNAGEIYSVWLRKIGHPDIDENMDPLLRKGCIRESKETLAVFLNQLGGVRWIDPLPAVQKAENKFYQLQVAQSVGILTPNTLISNDPLRVRHFYRQLQGDMIAKMLTPLTVSMEGNTPFVYTRRVQPGDLNDAESLCYSPMVFQEHIPKECELRIIYVDGKLFTGAIPSRELLEENQVDWRTIKSGKFRWEHFEVSDEFAGKLRKFMKKIGLRFGALDVILKPDGHYVFLEVNPTGEWGMLERDLGLPISQAIADVLTR
jgi:MvdC family ATP-grasp ribosomal peptide maturase